MNHPLDNDHFVNSVLGEEARFKGDLSVKGVLRIDGDFQGTLRTPSKVYIGSKGRVNSTIYARTVVVGGVVRGDIYASERVKVLASAIIIGTVYAPKLVAEEGVMLHGGFQITGKNIANEVHDWMNEKGKRQRYIGTQVLSEDENRIRGGIPAGSTRSF